MGNSRQQWILSVRVTAPGNIPPVMVGVFFSRSGAERAAEKFANLGLGIVSEPYPLVQASAFWQEASPLIPPSAYQEGE
jgi:hypothetical protein